MSRPLRIEFPGAFYHVTTRGNARKNIFFDENDRDQFLFLLTATLKKYNWLCHAFCLMNNHYHLLIETIDPTLSNGMKHLNGTYTQRHHFEHQSVGHIFQGRFKAFLIEEQTYFLHVARYIVLNPVRAGMVTDPAEYPWGSYRATAGLESLPSCLTVDRILGQFSDKIFLARKKYKMYVRDGVGLASPFQDLRGGIILGSRQFIDQLSDHPDSKFNVKEISTSQRMDGRPTLEELFFDVESSSERDAAIALATHQLQYSGAEVGRFLNLDTSTVCKIAKGKNSIFQT